jgi:hypothetical protein
LSSGWAQRRLTFRYLCIGEEEDTPTRKRVTWSESLEQRLGTAEAEMQGNNDNITTPLKGSNVFFLFNLTEVIKKRHPRPFLFFFFSRKARSGCTG